MFLLCIRGTLNDKTPETARETHNATAGNPQVVAAAQALGDLSHKVFVPTTPESAEFLILDIWKDPSGIEKFFSDENVRLGAPVALEQVL